MMTVSWHVLHSLRQSMQVHCSPCAHADISQAIDTWSTRRVLGQGTACCACCSLLNVLQAVLQAFLQAATHLMPS
jgi:hypothetical protein